MSGQDIFESQRVEMVAEIEAIVAALAAQLGREALSPRVMQALARVPRHAFVPAEIVPFAYLDTPLPIGSGKTISQPFIVALMTDLLAVTPGQRVLEIGTGLGYQAAVLAELGADVYSVELIPELAAQASTRLVQAGYDQVQLRVGNGRLGWPDHAPFDRIIVTTAPDLIPPALMQQLKDDGRMVIPAGLADQQQLLLVRRDAAGRVETTEILAVRFSEMDADVGPVGTS